MSAAVPRYLGHRFDEAPPGHRFRLYWAGWKTKDSVRRQIAAKNVEVNGATPKRQANLRQQLERLEKQLQELTDFGDKCEEETDAAMQAAAQGGSWIEACRALSSRQRALLPPQTTVSFPARTVAPLVTGMGLEHPTENGFAFFDPHGVPYLAGSSVKGVLRRAAEELCLLEKDEDWTLDQLWWLFGFEASSAYLADESEEWSKAFEDHVGKVPAETLAMLLQAADAEDDLVVQAKTDPAGALCRLAKSKRLAQGLNLRGALDVHDAFIVPPAGSGLRVDVMTPHYADYYQGKTSPSDNGQPNPIKFLCCPPGCEVWLHVSLSTAVGALPDTVRDGWQKRVRAVIDHAVRFIGFGSKTAVGYGRMRPDAEALKRAEKEAEDAAVQERYAARKAELDALGAISPIVEAFERPGAPENAIHDAFKQLERLSEGDQQLLAAELKRGFAERGLWSGKQSKKQKEKVQQIKKILGET